MSDSETIEEEIAEKNELIDTELIDEELVDTELIDTDQSLLDQSLLDIYDKSEERVTFKIETKKLYNKSYSAGILPFDVNNKTVYFLLGKDNEGYWSDFGGKAEYKDNNRHNITAAREFYEETMGAVYPINIMSDKLINNKICTKIVAKTANNANYYMYLLRLIHKDSYRIIFNKTYNFISFVNNNSKYKINNIEYKYLEKTDIQWISFDTIVNSLTDDNSLYPLRPIFKKSFSDNIQHIMNYTSIFL